MWSSLTALTDHVQVQASVKVVYTSIRGKGTQAQVFYRGRQALRGSVVWNDTLDTDALAIVTKAVHDFQNLISGVH
jgi:hypothetical protein